MRLRDEQPGNDAPLVADAVDGVAGNHRGQKIDQAAHRVGTEERELDEHRLEVVEPEGLFKRGMRMSFHTLMNPHMKKRMVMIANGPR